MWATPEHCTSEFDLGNPGAWRPKAGFGTSGRTAPQSWVWDLRAHRASKRHLGNLDASRLKLDLGNP